LQKLWAGLVNFSPELLLCVQCFCRLEEPDIVEAQAEADTCTSLNQG
jgi:hypothetical protein